MHAEGLLSLEANNTSWPTTARRGRCPYRTMPTWLAFTSVFDDLATEIQLLFLAVSRPMRRVVALPSMASDV